VTAVVERHRGTGRTVRTGVAVAAAGGEGEHRDQQRDGDADETRGISYWLDGRRVEAADEHEQEGGADDGGDDAQG
jgi:hypothetical protein